MIGEVANNFIQYAFYAVFVGIVVMGGIIGWPKLRQSKDLAAEHARLQARIAERRAEIEAVKDKKHRIRTDREFVEMLARRNRRLFPGEVVFVFDK